MDKRLFDMRAGEQSACGEMPGTIGERCFLRTSIYKLSVISVLLRLEPQRAFFI